MRIILIYLFKIFKLLKFSLLKPIDFIASLFLFYLNGVKIKSFVNYGIPLINVALGGKCIIGENFVSNNREISNPIGRFNRCSIIVGEKGELIIGNNVGISSTAIVCHKFIKIGDNVKIGGNVVIYDTDFHSINAIFRSNKFYDLINTKTKAILIEDNVFIGAHSTILKGVQIGQNSIIAASSVVTKSIPENEIWGGNPAKFLKRIE